MERRQRKGRGLASARLRNAAQIASFEQRRNRLQLNRRRGGIILGGERLQNGLGETKDSELCQMKYSQKSERRSEEPTSELQSLMRISYAVFCLKKTMITTLRY